MCTGIGTAKGMSDIDRGPVSGCSDFLVAHLGKSPVLSVLLPFVNSLAARTLCYLGEALTQQSEPLASHFPGKAGSNGFFNRKWAPNGISGAAVPLALW